MKIKFLLPLSILSLLILGACSQKNPKSSLPPPPRVDYYTHSIDYQGETLAMIAKWYTGSAANWQNILEHNPGLDPRRLKIGMNIRIPRNLIIKDKPMPKPSVTTTVAGIDQAETAPPTNSDANSMTAPLDETAKMQEDAMKLQEQALKESEEAKDEAQTAVINNQDYIDESVNNPTYPSTDDLGMNDSPAAPPTESGDGTPQKASMTDLLKKMLGGKQQGQENSVDDSTSPPPSMDAPVEAAPPSNEGKVKSRDELLKELTQDY